MKTSATLLVAALLIALSSFGQTFQSNTPISSVTSTENTGEKAQSKVWLHDDSWWAVFPNSAGTHIWRLNASDNWVVSSTLSTNTAYKADCKKLGNQVFVLLYEGSASQLIVADYSAGSYSIATSTPIAYGVGTSIATIDIDGTGRLWTTNEEDADIVVRYSDAPYTSFSAPFVLAPGVGTGDISMVICFDGQTGVLWSDQVTDRFGFRVHVDGDPATTWSANEVPASVSALPVGGGMADDHLNAAAAPDGTLYCAVKTEYDDMLYPEIALLVRRPSGAWDTLYEVSNLGTRPIVVIDEAAGTLKVAYTEADPGGDIVFKTSPLSAINFGPEEVLITGGIYNNVSSSKENHHCNAVFIAATQVSTTVVGAKTEECNPLACSTPIGNLQHTIGASGVLLEWDSDPQFIGCQVQGKPISAPGFATAPPVIGMAPSSFSISSSLLTPGTTYVWRVRCACSITPLVATPLSATDTFTTPGPASASRLEITQTATAIYLPAEATEAALFDLSGRLLKQTDSFRLSKNGLASGIYLLRVKVKGDTESMKVYVK